MANGIKIARNALYVTFGCTAIAATKAYNAEDGSIKKIGYAALAILGTGLATRAAMKLYERTVTTIISLPQPASEADIAAEQQ